MREHEMKERKSSPYESELFAKRIHSRHKVLFSAKAD